jgi:hypothetical protein
MTMVYTTEKNPNLATKLGRNSLNIIFTTQELRRKLRQELNL